MKALPTPIHASIHSNGFFKLLLLPFCCFPLSPSRSLPTGVNSTVGLNISSSGDIFIQPSLSSVAITGSSSSSGGVQYTQGTCTVKSDDESSSPCQQEASVNIPEPTGMWTCGASFEGFEFCSRASRCSQLACCLDCLVITYSLKPLYARFRGCICSLHVPTEDRPTRKTPPPAPWSGPAAENNSNSTAEACLAPQSQLVMPVNGTTA